MSREPRSERHYALQTQAAPLRDLPPPRDRWGWLRLLAVLALFAFIGGILAFRG